MQQYTADQFANLIKTDIQDAFERAKKSMIVDAISQGVVLTQDMINSFNTESHIEANNLIANLTLNFLGYGRFNDMKSIKAGNTPGTAFIPFVEKVGLENFGYVPGYFTDVRRRNGMVLTPAQQINRIAWGIATKRMQLNIISRQGTGFYNKNKGKLLAYARKALTEGLQKYPLQAIVREIEADNV